jgi:hypothetical protein
MRNPESSARAARRCASTNAFVIRMAKRLSATGSGHATAFNPAFHFKDARAWDTANPRDYWHWVERGGVSKQGIAPRCVDRNGCYGQKAIHPNAVEFIYVSHLLDDVADLADEVGADLHPVAHHARSRLWRRTHRAPSGRRSRQQKKQRG